jgi:hypothetical protein
MKWLSVSVPSLFRESAKSSKRRCETTTSVIPDQTHDRGVCTGSEFKSRRTTPSSRAPRRSSA